MTGPPSETQGSPLARQTAGARTAPASAFISGWIIGPYNLCTVHAEPCKVKLQSVGYWESETTHVRLNDYYPLELTSPEDDDDEENARSGTYTVLLDKVDVSPPYSIYETPEL